MSDQRISDERLTQRIVSHELAIADYRRRDDADPLDFYEAAAAYAATDDLYALRELRAIRAALEESERDAVVGRVVWKFVDRMGDHCEEDPAERILDEFYAAFNAAIAQEPKP